MQLFKMEYLVSFREKKENMDIPRAVKKLFLSSKSHAANPISKSPRTYKKSQCEFLVIDKKTYFIFFTK